MDGYEPELTSVSLPLTAGGGRRHAFLLVLDGPQLGDVFPLPPGKDLLLGRREDADLPLRDDGISRRHATVRVDERGATLRDEGSANGTFVDGVRVAEARLADGARITLGSATVLKFVWADELEARWQVRLAEGAQFDALTGLYNRRHLDERLDAELSASLRHARPLSLLLLDVDHFKSVNDQHGHLAGDAALREAARILKETIRKEDVLARFGGEEFVVLARETTRAGAEVLAERLRKGMERARCEWQGTALALTISVGVAVSARAGPFAPGDSARTLLAWADRALYLAKEGGRNRVVTLESEAWPPAASP